MSYSASDFVDDVCESATRHLGATIPETENQHDVSLAVTNAIRNAAADRRELLAALRGIATVTLDGESFDDFGGDYREMTSDEAFAALHEAVSTARDANRQSHHNGERQWIVLPLSR